MKIWVCDVCAEKVVSSAEPRLSACGVEGAFSTSHAPSSGNADPGDEPASEGHGVFLLSEATGVRQGHPTGIAPLDRALSGGIPDGIPVLIFGPSYSGKSTLAIQIACHLPGPALFTVPEMGRDMLRTIADRSGADISTVLVYEGPLEQWRPAAELAGARVLLIDSISKFPDPRRALEQAIRWSRETGGISLSIAHETRRGKPLFRAEYEPDAAFRITRRGERQTCDVQKARWNGYRGAIELRAPARSSSPRQRGLARPLRS